jgi:AhpD family alkylhydroperoxidase
MKDSENEQLPQRGDLQQIHGANLDVVNEESASPEIKRLYQQFREDFTRSQVPGILQCFATHPPLLTHMMGLAKSMLFVDGALGRQHKEMISTFVSATNKCNYCADSHACSFRVLGL